MKKGRLIRPVRSAVKSSQIHDGRIIVPFSYYWRQTTWVIYYAAHGYTVSAKKESFLTGNQINLHSPQDVSYRTSTKCSQGQVPKVSPYTVSELTMLESHLRKVHYGDQTRCYILHICLDHQSNWNIWDLCTVQYRHHRRSSRIQEGTRNIRFSFC